MRLPFPRRRPNEGIWGGFGSKAGEKAYQPPVASRSDPEATTEQESKLASGDDPVGKAVAPESRRSRWWRGRRTERTPPLALVGIGLGAIAFGVLALRWADSRAGRAFERGPQGPRDSGFYFFAMAIAALISIWGAYQIAQAWKQWRKEKAQRSVEIDSFD